VIFEQTSIVGSWLITPEIYEDDRGSFTRVWDVRELSSRSLPTHISQSSVCLNICQGTLRGLHYQAKPHEESKYVRCTRGAIHDVIIDLRPRSSTYRTWFTATLSASNMVTLMIPRGCAHGYITLEDGTELSYQMTHQYVPDAARGIRWNDPYFAIDWPLLPVIISERDRAFPDYMG
jgi:dTDP-4-dehydrorhamnose 3,5-epimerase